MTEENREGLQIGDSENYRSDKMQMFSHQMLVMETLRKCHEAGSHELRAGWFNKKMDNQGNTTLSYVEDTRKKFVESVKIAKAVMSCDFDNEAEKIISGYLETLEEEKKKLLKNQWEWYCGLPPRPRASYLGKVMRDFFSSGLGWYFSYLELQVECYRAILEELHRLSSRKGFYQSETFET